MKQPSREAYLAAMLQTMHEAIAFEENARTLGDPLTKEYELTTVLWDEHVAGVVFSPEDQRMHCATCRVPVVALGLGDGTRHLLECRGG